MYIVFRRVPAESYRRRLRSLSLCLCYVFRALITSLECWFYTSALGLVLCQILNKAEIVKTEFLAVGETFKTSCFCFTCKSANSWSLAFPQRGLWILHHRHGIPQGEFKEANTIIMNIKPAQKNRFKMILISYDPSYCIFPLRESEGWGHGES